jgi:hypothetical protein
MGKKMGQFRKFLFKISSLLLVLVFILSCSKNSVEDQGLQSVSTFFVDSIDGTSTISKVDTTYSLPTERLYNFKSCLKDIMQSKAIQNQKFNISGGSSNQEIMSDEQGCLNWSENISYHFLSDSNYIEIQRYIKAVGIHKGIQTIKLVLNPWSHGENVTGVIDPTKKSVSTLINSNNSISAFTNLETHSPIWAQNPKIIISDKEFTATGANMVLKFQTKLSLILKNSALQNVEYPISNGVFNIEFVLYNKINENGNSTYIKLANDSLQNISFTQDTLMAEMPFQLNTLPTKGQIYLGVKITAPNNQLGIDPFSAVFLVSDNNQIKTEGQLSITNENLEEIKTNIGINNVNNLKSSKINNSVALDSKPGLEVDKLDIKFFKIGNESTTDRQVFFTIKACIRNNLDSKLIRDEEFDVKIVSNKNILKLKTNQDGCLSFDDSIWHKFFGKEHYIKTSINISNKSFNLNKSIDIMLNPWDQSGNFGRDGRFVDDLGSVAQNPSNENAKISIDNYNFAVTKYNYEINKNLDLSMIKNGTLSLSAKVVNHSSLSYGRMGYEALRDGNYLLKWAIITLDQNDKPDSLISNGQKLVTTFGGDIKTDIGIKVSAFDKLNIRSRIVLALYTVKDSKAKNGFIEIEKNSGLEATPFLSTIVLNNDHEYQKMQLIDNNLGMGKGDLFDRLATLGNGNSNPKTAIDKILSVQNLTKISLSNESESYFLRDALANPTKLYTQKVNPAYYHEAQNKPALPLTSLMNFAKSGKLDTTLANQFCAFWINDYFRRMRQDLKDGVILPTVATSMTQICLSTVSENPNNFFQIEKKLLIKKVGNSKYIQGTTTNFSVGSTFSVSRSETDTKTKTWTWSSSIGLSADFFDVFKVGTTGSYAIAKAHANAKAESNSSQINSSTYLFLQNSAFDIELTQYEECAVIRLNPNLFMGKNSKYITIFNPNLKANEIAKAVTSGFMLCTGVNNNNPITKRENYYLVGQDYTNRGEQDGLSRENQQFSMSFRGQKDLTTFLNLIQSSAQLPTTTSNFTENALNTRNNLTNNAIIIPTWPGTYAD